MKKVLAIIVAYSMINQAFAHTQSGTLTQEQLVEILVDLELAKAMIGQAADDNQGHSNILFQEQAALIYESHAVDKEVFQKSYMSYINDPIHLRMVHEQLISKLEKLLQEF